MRPKVGLDSCVREGVREEEESMATRHRGQVDKENIRRTGEVLRV